MKNTSFFIALISALFFSLPLTATAQDFAGGSGTEEEPYLVETAEHLDNVRNHLSAHFRQIADIDLSGYSDDKGWDPIGESYSNSFTGSYDGNGFKIFNLVINRPYVANIGLFAYIGRDSKIVKVSLKDIQVTGRNNVGGLAGRNYGNIIHSSATGDVFGSYQTGGIVGGNYTRGTITKSFFTGTVTGEKKVGGLVGYQYHFGGEIKSCYTIAEVSGDNMVGGLVGLTNGSISECYAKGKVSGENDVGGLVGSNEEGTIINCYASASVSGSPSIGGLVGPVLNGVITNSYYDQETAGRQDGGKGVPKSTDEMKQKDTFQDWDFKNTWSIIEGETYPFLRWELKAIFSTDTTEGVVPLNVKFTDQSTGDIDSWKWMFGDGNISEEQNPTYKYENEGIYTVILKVSDYYKTEKASRKIHAHPDVKADFTASPIEGNAPLRVRFRNQSRGADSWEWDFGDGRRTSRQKSVTYLYEQPGTYTASLSVNGYGGSDTASKDILVKPRVVRQETRPQRREELKARVRYSRGQFNIINANTFDWYDVRLQVNSGLIRSGYIHEVRRIPAASMYTIGAYHFATRRGERLNTFRIKPQNLRISAKTKDGHLLSGTVRF